MKFSLAVTVQLLLCSVDATLKRPVRSLQWTHGQSYAKRDVNPSLLYPAHNLSVPIDHFHNDSLYEPHKYEGDLICI